MTANRIIDGDLKFLGVIIAAKKANFLRIARPDICATQVLL